MLWSIGAGLMPLPILDIVAVTAIQVDMLKQIASEYGVSFSESEGKAWVSALAGNLMVRIGANALKLIPGIGSVVGGLTSAIASGASSYAIGQVATNHFESGGTFSNMDMDAARRTYEQEFERGKQVAKDPRQREEGLPRQAGAARQAPRQGGDHRAGVRGAEEAGALVDVAARLRSEARDAGACRFPHQPAAGVVTRR